MCNIFCRPSSINYRETLPRFFHALNKLAESNMNESFWCERKYFYLCRLFFFVFCFTRYQRVEARSHVETLVRCRRLSDNIFHLQLISLKTMWNCETEKKSLNWKKYLSLNRAVKVREVNQHSQFRKKLFKGEQETKSSDQLKNFARE